MRDGALLCLALYAKTRLFVCVTAAWALAVVGFGALYAFLLFGWHGFRTLLLFLSYFLQEDSLVLL